MVDQGLNDILLKKIDSLQNQLVKEGLITKEDLTFALNVQSESNQHLGEILVNNNIISKDKLTSFIGKYFDLPFVDLDNYSINPKVIEKVQFEIAKKYELIPLFEVESILTIAISNPINVFAIDEVKKHTKLDIDLVISTPEKINSAIQIYYLNKNILEKGLSDVEVYTEDVQKKNLEKETESLSKSAIEPTIVKMVNSIFEQAKMDHASDIHINPQKEELLLRFRIDGVLHEVKKLPISLNLPLISRIKIMANMDIAETRNPQDGSIKITLGSDEYELRVATYPTINGETVAIRLLEKKNKFSTIESLGVSNKISKFLKTTIKKKHGILLVTGPTGSGKTTIMYTLLKLINPKEKNIISIEDPVEMDLQGINQAQVNTKAGLTFAAALRSILRIDPDVIMIGEIRDLETAQLAVRAALTGHFVISTLHTNNAISSVTRLIELGIEPYLLSSSLEGIINQRLVRVICPNCKTNIEYSIDSMKNFSDEIKDASFYIGEGCRSCFQTGYRGRTGLFEFFKPSTKMRAQIQYNYSENKLRQLWKESDNSSLKSDGFNKAIQGITTLPEVISVTQDYDRS